MRAAAVLAVIALLGGQAVSVAQTRRAPARRPAAPPTPPKVEAAMVKCPMVLGDGVQTGRLFCDVQIGHDPASGIIVTLPPHTGAVTLTFDLHNRHTYSEEMVRSNRAYHRYTATIGVLTLDNTLVSRAVVMNEFRTAADLVDRIGGGSGPGGLKAVAPTGSEAIVMTLPAAAQSVSILGEKLSVIRAGVDGTDDFNASGRPIAVISNLMVEYRPGPAPRPARGSVTPKRP